MLLRLKQGRPPASLTCELDQLPLTSQLLHECCQAGISVTWDIIMAARRSQHQGAELMHIILGTTCPAAQQAIFIV